MTMTMTMTSLETGRTERTSWPGMRSSLNGGSLKLAWTCEHILPNELVDLTDGFNREVLVQDPTATYNPVHISKLTDTLTQIHFPTYFSKFNVHHEPKKVILNYPPYLESLSDILDETSSEIIEAYLIIQAALNLSPYLGMDTEAWNAQRSLVEALTGIKKGAVGDRAEYCVGQVEERLGFAAGRYFVNETFGGESREKGTMVIEGPTKCPFTDDGGLCIFRYREDFQEVALTY